MIVARLFFCSAAAYSAGAGDWRGIIGALAVWLIVEVALLDHHARERRRRRAWDRSRYRAGRLS